MKWTDEMDAQLKALIAQKLVGRQIAVVMGLTRSAVTHQVRKLGLSITGHRDEWWPDEKKAELRRLIENDKLTRFEAAEILGYSRGAVSGMIKRMGLLGRPNGVTRAGRERIAQAQAVRQTERVAAKPSEPPKRTPPIHISFRPLPGSTPVPFGTPYVCKWPIDGFDDFMCCGAPRNHHAYCDEHIAIAYTPNQSRKARPYDPSTDRQHRRAA